MIPRDYQIEKAREGYAVLKKYMICYLAMEERTGKSLISMLIAEECSNVRTVMIITKKKAVPDWQELLDGWVHTNIKWRVVNYHQAHKYGRPDLMILDEAHNYLSGYPKRSAMHMRISQLTQGIPLIYLSATPHAQGYQMLYHQFALSTWSPWRKYSDFLRWFENYGIPSTAWIHGRSVPVYTQTDERLVKACVDHLFVTSTRKALGFKHEPKDKLHYVELSEKTRDIYNVLIKDKIYEEDDFELVCDTGMKFRSALHMIEGGVLKTEELRKVRGKFKIKPKYVVLPNREKVDYIKRVWGDTDDLVIYYQYIAEGTKLRASFKKATILQGTSYAEGIDLTHKKTIVVYSMDFSTARYTQRRARQASMQRDEQIIVHFLLVSNAVSDQVYATVAINKTNFVDSVFERNTI